MKLFKKTLAFTLAEVLITLTIIGIVAAVALPAIKKNTNKQELVTSLKKAYYTLTNVTDEIIAEYGDPKSWGSTKANNEIIEAYKQKLRFIKFCDKVADCFHPDIVSKFPESSMPGFANSKAIFQLSDGMVISVAAYSTYNTSCQAYGTSNACMHFYVDVNGDSGPNQPGYDLFGFLLQNDGVYPRGYDEWSYDNGTEKVTVKSEDNCKTPYIDCTYKVIKEGKINY